MAGTAQADRAAGDAGGCHPRSRVCRHDSPVWRHSGCSAGAVAFRTAMAMAFFCPTNTTRRLPGVTPRVEKIGPAEPAGDERVNLGLVSGSADDPSGAQMVSTSISI